MYEYESRSFYERINRLIKDNKTSQKKIESILGLPNGMISKWSESVPGIDKVVKIAQYFNVSIDFLATGNDFPTDKEEVILKLLALDDRDISYIEGRIDEKLENSKYKKDATTYVASTAS